MWKDSQDVLMSSGVSLTGWTSASSFQVELGRCPRPVCVSVALRQRQELLPGLGVLQVDPQHGAGHRAAVHLLDAAHDHAHVPAHTHTHTEESWATCEDVSNGFFPCVHSHSFNHHGNAFGLQSLR